MNNATIGISVQNKICKLFKLELNEYAKSQFQANSSNEIEELYEEVINKAFLELGARPKKCTSYEVENKDTSKINEHNFILESGKTLSIRTNKKPAVKKTAVYKIAPRVVGQAGYEKLNYHFGHLQKGIIETQDDIKELIYNNIDKMLPIFIDYLFISDFTIWFYEEESLKYKIIERGEAPDLIFNKNDLEFTCGRLENWKESTTLKYNGISFAEIQVHKNRTFKFRFLMKPICEWLREVKINNETLGMTAEKVICDIFSLERDIHLIKRSNKNLEKDILGTINEAFKYLPAAIKHTGSLRGERGGVSKCSYDFILEGDKTLSLKTNYGKKVCPPEVGQPGAKTFLLKFGEILDIDNIDNNIFKKVVLEKVDIMMPIYLKYLLDSDYLLWIYKEGDKFLYNIINSESYRLFKWDKDSFSFTRTTIEEWNESNTIKYKGITIGEFQVHSKRNSYKFRFNMANLLKLFNEYQIESRLEFVAE